VTRYQLSLSLSLCVCASLWWRDISPLSLSLCAALWWRDINCPSLYAALCWRDINCHSLCAELWWRDINCPSLCAALWWRDINSLSLSLCCALVTRYQLIFCAASTAQVTALWGQHITSLISGSSIDLPEDGRTVSLRNVVFHQPDHTV
jgi:hypothetical protein